MATSHQLDRQLDQQPDDGLDHGVDGAVEPLVWRALADPNRRRVLDLLTERPHNTGQLASQFDISRIAVMKHLEVLVAAGLVLSRKRGRERWHYVNPAPLMGLHERWTSPLAAGLATGVRALKATVEAPMSAEVRTLEIELEQAMAASPAAVFSAITETPGAWWGAPYVRPDATGLRLEPTVGGLLVEELDGGEFVMARVEGIIRDRWLVLRGALHLGPADGRIEITLTPDAGGGDGGTVLSLSFRAYGLLDPEVAAAFTEGWRELLTVRLKRFVEHGERLGIDP